jgi:uncharacterized protein
MLARQEAQLNLSAILRQSPGSDDEVAEEGLLDAPAELVEADGLRLQGPLSWSLSVRRIGGDDNDFFLEGNAEGVALLECRRCLSEVATPVGCHFFYPMRYLPSHTGPLEIADDEDAEDDLLVFGEPVVDFAALLVQLLAIELPLTALCREDCKGLSLDGVNLNEHPDHTAPDAPKAEPESPFKALESLEIED